MARFPARSTARRLLVALVAVATTIGATPARPGGDVDRRHPTATLHLPESDGVRGRPMTSSVEPLDGPIPYVEVEYLATGLASDHGALGEFFVPNPPAGRTAPYTTRVLVRMPADPDHFNGTAFFEWNNVTFQTDLDALWATSNDMLMRHGYAFVAVSAQKQAVDNSPMSLKAWDPVRYGNVAHPGDQFSYDIFAQASRAVLECVMADREQPCPLPLGEVDVAIATGSSQSGLAMHRFVNHYHERVPDLFDGYLGQVAGVEQIADDLVPVLWVNSESESGTISQSAPGPLYRYWEIAGGSHGDIRQASYTLALVGRDQASVPTSETYSRFDQYGERQPGGQCPQNFMPSRWAVNAAVVAIDRWARDHADAPAVLEPFERDAAAELVRDQHENVVGGLRLPPMTVPVAGYVGNQCWLVGRMRQFDAATLAELYPTRDDYLAKLQAATTEAVEARILLPEDGAHLMELARNSPLFGDPDVRRR